MECSNCKEARREDRRKRGTDAGSAGNKLFFLKKKGKRYLKD